MESTQQIIAVGACGGEVKEDGTEVVGITTSAGRYGHTQKGKAVQARARAK